MLPLIIVSILIELGSDFSEYGKALQSITLDGDELLFYRFTGARGSE